MRRGCLYQLQANARALREVTRSELDGFGMWIVDRWKCLAEWRKWGKKREQGVGSPRLGQQLAILLARDRIFSGSLVE